MLNLTNFLRGHTGLTATLPFPQRLLNLCANRGILFWGVTWQNANTISLVVPTPSVSQVQELAEQIGGGILQESRHGLPHFLARFRHRFAFVLGFALSVFTVCVLSNFILVIQVTGNHRVKTAEILNGLEQAGLYIGAYGPDLEVAPLAQEAMHLLDGVSWISVNLSGTRALVQITEATLPPEIQNRTGLYDVVSTAGGIIEEMQVHQGESMVAVGDTVLPGELLIRGTVELKAPLYSEHPSQWLFVHGSGKIVARTWHTLTAVTPLQAQVKVPQPEEDVALEFYAFGNRWSWLDYNQSLSRNYDKVRTTWRYPQELPLGVAVITQTPYQREEQSLNLTASQEMLQQALLDQLSQGMGAGGEILQTEFIAEEREGLLYVTLIGECREEIGREIPGTVPPEATGEESVPEE